MTTMVRRDSSWLDTLGLIRHGADMVPDKHIALRIEQLLVLAKASSCPRRKFGAMIYDPVRKTVMADGYNGSPRGGGKLCGGDYCERDGKPRKLHLTPAYDPWIDPLGLLVVASIDDTPVRPTIQGHSFMPDTGDGLVRVLPRHEATELERTTRPDAVKSGTQVEVGCHHAEMNAICNAAAQGVSTAGAWLLVTGEPCRMCAKLIHHAGIVKVVCVDNGYSGIDGVAYLREHGVEVEKVPGPKDER